MANVTIKVKVTMQPSIVLKAAKEACQQPLLQCALAVERIAKESMRSGRLGEGKFVASAPGSPPNVRTGELRASITNSGVDDKLSVTIGPTEDKWWSVVHEFGGKFHPPRPFMRPALYKARYLFAALFAKASIARTKAAKILFRAGE